MPPQELPEGWSTLPPGWSANPPSGMMTMPKSEVSGSYVRRKPESNEGFLSGLIKGPVETVAHPLISASGQGEPLTASGMAPGGMYPTTMSVRPIDMKANRDVQMEAQQGQKEAAQAIAANPSYAAGSLLGNAALMTGIGMGAEGLSRAPGWLRPTSSPSIVPPLEIASERLAQNLRPVGGIKPETIKAIQSEAPAIREFAQRTDNPLNTKAEGFKAAQGVANENLQHFNEHYYEPNKNVQVQLPSGTSDTLGHVTTVEKLVKRISDINDQMRATAGKSEGATMTAEQRTGLEGEVKALRSKLYDTLSEKTGTPVDQIRDLREGYGGQYAVADALQSGRMGMLERTGARSQAGGSPSMFRAGVLDWPDRFITWARGGEEAIGNRQFRSRIRAFEPQAPDRPMPNIPPPRPYETAPISPEMEARIRAKGTGTPTLRPTPEFLKPVPMQGPEGRLPSVNEVPALKESADVAQQFRNEQNAKYAQEKAAAEEARKWRFTRLNP